MKNYEELYNALVFELERAKDEADVLYKDYKEAVRKFIMDGTEQFEIKKIKYDQIICEFNSWVHIAWKSPTGKQRGQILTAKKINGKTQYLAGLVK